MSEHTKIEWCDHTFNPWIGCTKVGPGCDNCYAKADFEDRKHRVVWGAGHPRSRTSIANWKQPVKWNRQAGVMQKAWEIGVQMHDGDESACIAAGFIKPKRPKVFCASLADVFDNAVDPQWRDDLWKLIRYTPNLDWLLLTKRIGNAPEMLPSGLIDHWPHVWIGATIVNQEEADRDIPKLLAVPAHKRFLSMEPLLGPVDLTNVAPPTTEGQTWHGIDSITPVNRELRGCIDWVIVGGESGPNARPTHPKWARSLRDQCQAAGVPFLFKQWGEWVPRSDCYHLFEDGKSCADYDPGAKKWPCIRLTETGRDDRRLENEHIGDSAYMQRVGKKMAGRLLDSYEWNGVPR